MKIKPSLIIFPLIMMLLGTGLFGKNAVYASSTSESIEQKVNQQSKDIEKNMQNSPLPSNGDKFNNSINEFNNSSNNSSGEWRGEEIKGTMQKGLVSLTIGFRKYAIPMYILFQLIMTVLISTVGSKSLQKRKLYIIYSISFTVLFLFILNIPVLAIYFQNRAVEEIIGGGGFYEALYGAINFLRVNSPVISVLLVIYGVTNIVLSKRDLPRRLQGKYLIKFSIVILIVMQTLPFIIKLII